MTSMAEWTQGLAQVACASKCLGMVKVRAFQRDELLAAYGCTSRIGLACGWEVPGVMSLPKMEAIVDELGIVGRIVGRRH